MKWNLTILKAVRPLFITNNAPFLCHMLWLASYMYSRWHLQSWLYVKLLAIDTNVAWYLWSDLYQQRKAKIVSGISKSVSTSMLATHARPVKLPGRKKIQIVNTQSVTKRTKPQTVIVVECKFETISISWDDKIKEMIVMPGKLSR